MRQGGKRFNDFDFGHDPTTIPEKWKYSNVRGQEAQRDPSRLRTAAHPCQPKGNP